MLAMYAFYIHHHQSHLWVDFMRNLHWVSRFPNLNYVQNGTQNPFGSAFWWCVWRFHVYSREKRLKTAVIIHRLDKWMIYWQTDQVDGDSMRVCAIRRTTIAHANDKHVKRRNFYSKLCLYLLAPAVATVCREWTKWLLYRLRQCAFYKSHYLIEYIALCARHLGNNEKRHTHTQCESEETMCVVQSMCGVVKKL